MCAYTPAAPEREFNYQMQRFPIYAALTHGLDASKILLLYNKS